MKMKMKILVSIIVLMTAVNISAKIIYDTGFDNDGLRIGNPFDDSTRRGLTAEIIMLPDGKYLVGGSAQSIPNNPFQTAFAVQKLNSNGTPDISFGTNGRFIFIFDQNAPSQTNFATSMAIQPNGKILLAGYTASSAAFDNLRATIVRINPDGTLDTTFGNSGLYRSPNVANGNIESDSKYFDIEILPNGNILAVGNVIFGNASNEPCHSSQSPWCSSVTLFTADGSFLGRTTYKLSPEANMREYISDVEIQADGKWAAAISSETETAPYRIARFNPDATKDLTFAGNGIATVNSFFGSTNINSYALEIQADGKIITSGKKNNSVITARFNPNGTLDSSYGVNGLTDATTTESRNISGVELIIQPDGKILSVGANKLIRFNSDGSRDTSFGPNGQADIEPTQTNEIGSVYPIDLIYQPDGQITFAARTTLTNPGAGPGDSWTIGRVRNINIAFDFDGDFKADISIFRPSVGEWWYLKSSNGSNYAAQFGSSSDKPTPADFTGDGKTDIAFFRPSSGQWFVLRSEDSTFYSFPFGNPTDLPAPGDYDGDGRADAAVFRPSAGVWYILRSSDGGTIITPFGISEDKPVIGDYDGDGKADIAVFRPSLSEWWINRSRDGLLAFQFGATGDKAVPGDYTGDGKTDGAFFRPSNGTWYVLRSENSSFYAFPFGSSSDTPAPGDYDGDGRTDAAVFRPSNNVWYISGTTSGTQFVSFGTNGDLPLPNAYVVP